MMNTNYTNGEVLEALRTRIDAKLNQKRMKQSDRDMYEIFQLFVIFMASDHPKTQTMWGVFRPFAWGVGIFAATLIGLAASGKLHIEIVH